MEVKKSQHKYVIGPKGNSLQEILDRTGVSVEIPPSDSASETVILRGEPEKLGQALTEVYAKVAASRVGLGTGPCWVGGSPALSPAEQPGSWFVSGFSQANSFTVSSVSAPSWLHRFIIGKKGQNLAKITQQMPKVRRPAASRQPHALSSVRPSFGVCRESRQLPSKTGTVLKS